MDTDDADFGREVRSARSARAAHPEASSHGAPLARPTASRDLLGVRGACARGELGACRRGRGAWVAGLVTSGLVVAAPGPARAGVTGSSSVAAARPAAEAAAGVDGAGAREAAEAAENPQNAEAAEAAPPVGKRPRAAAPRRDEEGDAGRPEPPARNRHGAFTFSLPAPSGAGEGDDRFRLRVGGVVQFDARAFPGTDPRRPVTTFFPGRVRPILEGKVYGFVTFRLMPDFGQGTVTLQEAWADLEAAPFFHVRFGKDKANFGLERLQSETDIVFIERSQVTGLVPNRDVGLQVWGTLRDGALDYALGAWNGVPDGGSGDADIDRKKDLIGRLFLRPFRLTSIAWLHDIGFGIAGSHGIRHGSPKAAGLPAYRTPAQQPLFAFAADPAVAANNAYANGPIDRWSPQGYAYVGPVGLLFEYVETRQAVTQGARSATLVADGYQVTLAVVLTGERESYRGIDVLRPASLADGTFGAIELAARYDRTNPSKAAFGRFADGAKNWSGADAFWGGVNWYLNNSVKLSADLVHSSFEGNAKGLLDTEDAVLAQGQITF